MAGQLEEVYHGDGQAAEIPANLDRVNAAGLPAGIPTFVDALCHLKKRAPLRGALFPNFHSVASL